MVLMACAAILRLSITPNLEAECEKECEGVAEVEWRAWSGGPPSFWSYPLGRHLLPQAVR